jgi:hypothetical protein
LWQNMDLAAGATYETTKVLFRGKFWYRHEVFCLENHLRIVVGLTAGSCAWGGRPNRAEKHAKEPDFSRIRSASL